LDDGAFPPNRTTAAYGEGGGHRLDDSDPGTDATTPNGNRFHHFRDSMAFGFPGVKIYHGTDQQAADGRNDDNVSFTPTGRNLREPVVPDPADALDEVIGNHSTQAGANADDQRGGD
jgi:hypothetical protein